MARIQARIQCVLLLIATLFLSACTTIEKISDLPIGTGFSALDLCSRIFVSGEDEQLIIDKVISAKVFPLSYVWHLDINSNEQTVAVSAPFFPGLNTRTAVYRPGLGCTLAITQTTEQIRSQAFIPFDNRQINEIAPLATDLEKTDKNEWLTDTVVENLEAIIDSMFLENLDQDGFHQVNTFASLISYDGKIIAERYEENHHGDMRMLSWSMAKTITSLIAGILYDQGRLKLDEPIPALSQQGKTASIAQVMNMSSGLNWQEGYKGTSDVSNMLYTEGNSAEYVAQRKQISPAGRTYQYSTGDTQLLAQVISEKISPTLQGVYDFYQTQLFHKLGIYNGVIEHDESGTFLGGARVFLTPRDWLKIGQLIANKGLWKFSEHGEERRIVSEKWIDFMSTPSPASDYYGGQIWLNDMEAEFPEIPRDALFLRGHAGQFVGIVPSRKLVMTRLGAYGPKVEPSAYARYFMLDMIKVLKQLPN